MALVNWGDIVGVDFPFSDGSGSKLRPAVVLSNDKVMNIYGDCLLMAITGNVIKYPQMYHLKDWQYSNLTKPCCFKPQIFTLEHRLIGRKIGQLTAEDSSSLESLLSLMLSK